MQKNLIASFLISSIFAFSAFGQNNEETPLFKAPEKLIKQTVFYTSFPVVTDTTTEMIYFYFTKGTPDTVVVASDSIDVFVGSEYETEKRLEELKGLQIETFQVYLLNSQGQLIYPKAFEDIRFAMAQAQLYREYNPYTDEEYSSGYSTLDGHYLYASFKNDFGNLPTIGIGSEISISKNHPLLVKYKGKWGLMRYDGSLIVPMEYDKIEWGEQGMELYKGDILSEIRKY